MITLGITGGMGSGKSHICKIFAENGIPVYDTDRKVKDLLNNNAYLKLQMWQKYGENCYKKGIWNREYIVQLSKKNPEIIDVIGKIIEPYLAQDIKDFKKIHSGELTGYSGKLIVIESAILIKSKMLMEEIDKILVVTAPFDLRIKRIKERDPFRTDEEINYLLNNQKDAVPLLCKTDYIIDTEKTEAVEESVKKIIDELIV
jgi:dephospho-CoA kinase